MAEAFLDQVRDIARWDRTRIDGFERKAGVVLSSSLVTFALLPNLLRPAARLGDSRIPLWLIVAAAVFLAAAAAASGICMAVKRSTYVSVDQLREEWEGISRPGDATSDLKPDGALALTVQAMLVRGDATLEGGRIARWWNRNRNLPVLEALRDVADFKARWFASAVVASSIAVACTGTVVVWIFVDRALNG